MKGVFKSKPRTPADVVSQTRDLLLFVDRIPETRESKHEEKSTNSVDVAGDVLIDGGRTLPQKKLLLEELIKFLMMHGGQSTWL